MKAIRTEQIYINGTDATSHMRHLWNNPYNQAIYILRNQFFNREKTLSYGNPARQLAEPLDMEDHNNFQKIPSQTAQWSTKK